jgi:hypothetical protein
MQKLVGIGLLLGGSLLALATPVRAESPESSYPSASHVLLHENTIVSTRATNSRELDEILRSFQQNLRNNPDLADSLRENPRMLEAVLKQNPELAIALSQNPETIARIQRMLN